MLTLFAQRLVLVINFSQKSNMKKPYFFLFFCFLCITHRGTAQDTLRLTLRQADSLLLVNNLTLITANYQIDIAKAQVLQTKLGDYVEKGQLLAVVRSGEAADFERQLVQAKSDLLVTQKNLRVQQDLLESRLTSEREVTAAQGEVQKAKADLARINELMNIYNINQQTEYRIQSPLSGFIIEKNINRDMTLRSDKSDNVFTIAQIDEVWVTANVYESEIAKVKLGMPTEIKVLSYPDKKFNGTVDKIFNVLDPISKTMRIRIKLKNPDYLFKPEMVATVKIIAEEPRQAVAIPSGAVVFDKSRQFVIIYKDRNHLETREIIVENSTEGISYVKNGLQDGEVVISKNALFVYEAMNEK